MHAVGRNLGAFTSAMLALLAVLAWPAHLWGGNPGVMALLAGWGLVVVPGWAVLLLQGLVSSPQAGVFLALGSTAGRLLLVACGALLIVNSQLLPEFQFAAWVVVCYLVALTIETLLVLKASRPEGLAGVGDALVSVTVMGGR